MSDLRRLIAFSSRPPAEENRSSSAPAPAVPPLRQLPVPAPGERTEAVPGLLGSRTRPTALVQRAAAAGIGLPAGGEEIHVPPLPPRDGGTSARRGPRQAPGPGFRVLRWPPTLAADAESSAHGAAAGSEADVNLEVPDPGVERVQSVLDALDPQARWQVMAVPALPEGTPRLVVTDVDSTLIGQEVIDDLGARAGARERIAAITERAMRGELDFAASLRERVAALAGLSASVLEEVREDLVLNPGARELVARLHARGDRIGAVSGGFCAILDPLGASLGLDRTLANGLEIADDGSGPRLTGRVLGPVVDAAAKRRALTAWAGELGVAEEATTAMGDGANDLLMVEAAGLGVAYCAKPALDAAAAARIPVPRLDALLALLG